MDFVGELPEPEGFNMILVVTALYGPIAGSSSINRGGIRRKVMNLVTDRNATLRTRARLSGVTITAPANFAVLTTSFT